MIFLAQHLQETDHHPVKARPRQSFIHRSNRGLGTYDFFKLRTKIDQQLSMRSHRDLDPLLPSFKGGRRLRQNQPAEIFQYFDNSFVYIEMGSLIKSAIEEES